eukprot:559745-Pelagomonas_calceolata.AAC.4
MHLFDGIVSLKRRKPKSCLSLPVDGQQLLRCQDGKREVGMTEQKKRGVVLWQRAQVACQVEECIEH